MRICRGIGEEQEKEVERIARLMLDDWVLFSLDNTDYGSRQEYLDLKLGEYGASPLDEEALPQVRTCLLWHLAHADAHLADSDEARLRELRDEIRRNDTVSPGRDDYFRRLEREVERSFFEKQLSGFRRRRLASELNALLLGFRR